MCSSIRDFSYEVGEVTLEALSRTGSNNVRGSEIYIGELSCLAATRYEHYIDALPRQRQGRKQTSHPGARNQDLLFVHLDPAVVFSKIHFCCTIGKVITFAQDIGRLKDLHHLVRSSALMPS
jgi:hypothetical protein